METLITTEFTFAGNEDVGPDQTVDCSGIGFSKFEVCC